MPNELSDLIFAIRDLLSTTEDERLKRVLYLLFTVLDNQIPANREQMKALLAMIKEYDPKTYDELMED